MPSAGFTAVIASGNLLSQLPTKSTSNRQLHWKTYSYFIDQNYSFDQNILQQRWWKVDAMNRIMRARSALELTNSVLFFYPWPGFSRAALRFLLIVVSSSPLACFQSEMVISNIKLLNCSKKQAWVILPLEFSLYALLSYEKIICSKAILGAIAVIHDKYVCAWLYSSGSKLYFLCFWQRKRKRAKKKSFGNNNRVALSKQYMK